METVRYEAPGWGIGEVGVEDGRVLYHELPRPRRDDSVAKQASGGPSPPPPVSHGYFSSWRPDALSAAGATNLLPAASLAGKGARVGAEFAKEVAQRLTRYFAGAVEAFDDLQLDLSGYTPFQRALTKALRAIPRGETVTYGELAALAGRPGAPRAAGNFCGISRFGIIVPCHRVIAASGLGSYGSFGTEYKRRLLELEGADVPL